MSQDLKHRIVQMALNALCGVQLADRIAMLLARCVMVIIHGRMKVEHTGVNYDSHEVMHDRIMKTENIQVRHANGKMDDVQMKVLGVPLHCSTSLLLVHLYGPCCLAVLQRDLKGIHCTMMRQMAYASMAKCK